MRLNPTFRHRNRTKKTLAKPRPSPGIAQSALATSRGSSSLASKDCAQSYDKKLEPIGGLRSFAFALQGENTTSSTHLSQFKSLLKKHPPLLFRSLEKLDPPPSIYPPEGRVQNGYRSDTE